LNAAEAADFYRMEEIDANLLSKQYFENGFGVNAWI